MPSNLPLIIFAVIGLVALASLFLPTYRSAEDREAARTARELRKEKNRRYHNIGDMPKIYPKDPVIRSGSKPPPPANRNEDPH